MHQASVGFHCPECTKAGAQKVYQGVASLRATPIVTYVLMGLNFAVFAIGLLVVSAAERSAYLTGGGITSFHQDFAAVAKVYGNSLLGPVQVPGGVGDGEWYRIVTSGFVHYGLLHIAFNMWALWVLGRAVEQAEGRLRMGLIYGVSLLAGSFGTLLLTPHDYGAGASGAIFGLMGALVMIFRSRGIPLRNSPILSVIAINLVITFAVPEISKGAHLGGLLGGLAAGWILCDLAPRPGVGNRVAYGLCAALGVALFAASVVFSTQYQL